MIVGYYFEKRKGLANAVTSSGIGAGVFTIPPIFNYWMHNYGYLGTMVSFAIFLTSIKSPNLR